MSTRREKSKQRAQRTQTAAVLETERGKVTHKAGDTLVENGKFFLDLAKLVFAGIVLTGIREVSEMNISLLVSGLVVMVLLYLLGILQIRNGNIKKNRI